MSTNPRNEGVPRISEPTLLVYTPAPRPVGPYAFMYEASDVPPGMTIDEFRSQRPGSRRRRARHAWHVPALSRTGRFRRR
jgi:hypothetical protein